MTLKKELNDILDSNLDIDTKVQMLKTINTRGKNQGRPEVLKKSPSKKYQSPSI